MSISPWRFYENIVLIVQHEQKVGNDKISLLNSKRRVQKSQV
jgi:hypothetical protein